MMPRPSAATGVSIGTIPKYHGSTEGDDAKQFADANEAH